jgi:hypothetical protein
MGMKKRMVWMWSKSIDEVDEKGRPVKNYTLVTEQQPDQKPQKIALYTDHNLGKVK